MSVTKRSMHSDQRLRQSLNVRASEGWDSQSSSKNGIIERVRQRLVTSKIPLEDFFKQIDTGRDGTISNLEFINAFRKLNLGLSLSEINQILLSIDRNQDGRVAYTDFMNIFKLEYNSNAITINNLTINC